MKKVMMKLPASVMIPVYLIIELAVSVRSLDSINGTEYLFRNRYCSAR
jgi:hypothetical protein